MKKILCKITAVEPNYNDYGNDFFNNLPMPNVGDEVVVERPSWYPFSPSKEDGESVVPRGDLSKDVNGNECGQYLYYTRLEQIILL